VGEGSIRFFTLAVFGRARDEGKAERRKPKA